METKKANKKITIRREAIMRGKKEENRWNQLILDDVNDGIKCIFIALLS